MDVSSVVVTLCGFDLTHRRGQVPATEPAPEWAQSTDPIAGPHICAGCLQSLATDRVKSTLGATELGRVPAAMMIDGNRDTEPFVALAMIGAAVIAGADPKQAFGSLSPDGQRAAWNAVFQATDPWPAYDRLPTGVILAELTGPRTVDGRPATGQEPGQTDGMGSSDNSTTADDGHPTPEEYDDRGSSVGEAESVGTDGEGLEDHPGGIPPEGRKRYRSGVVPKGLPGDGREVREALPVQGEAL